MYNILFVCYGNICRSPMAEMIFKDLIYKNNKRYMFTCSSRATSVEELGNDIYPKAREALENNGIKVEKHRAAQIKKDDYLKYDYIIAMEERNKRDILNIVGEDFEDKIHLLGEFTNNIKDIDDPWYTGDFIKAYQDIYEGCISLYHYLLKKEVHDEI